MATKTIVNRIVATAVVSFLTLASTSVLAATTTNTVNIDQADKMEKCYGIAKSGMNDCQTKTASCAGSATKDKQKDAFLFLPKGDCAKIAGGSLIADAVDKK